MRIRTNGCLVVAGILVFTLADGSGQDAYPFGLRAQFAINAGKSQEALDLYRLAYRVAESASLSEVQHRLLNNIGACQLALFRYKDAAQTLLRVRSLADTAHNEVLLGSADGNLAAVYAQMDDLGVAEIYARESIQSYTRSGKLALRPRALITLGDILSRKGVTREGEQAYRSAIDAAGSLQDWPSVFNGWLHYGKVLLETGQLNEADRALAESSLALEKTQHRKSAEDALLWNLSRLRLRQNDLTNALSLIDSAVRTASQTGGRIPLWRLYQTRAEVKLAEGKASSALEDARTALHWARILRANIVPDDENRVGIEGVLDEVFSVLIEAGNRVYLKTGDPDLLRETFEAAEESRANSLDALLPVSGNWRARLATPEYRYKLSQLLKEERAELQGSSPAGYERLVRIETELSEMEAGAGAIVRAQTGTVLDRVRRNLTPRSALLSFRLGDRASWLWTVENGSLQLYRLPARALLMAEIQDFKSAILNNDTHRINKAGAQLYSHLLGGTKRSLKQSAQWFISLDEPLYTLDFPSLVVEIRRDGPVYLTQSKSLQILPGAQLLGTPDRGTLAARRFVLAGDGIYNRADPRYAKQGLVHPASWGMARLPGSGAEVRFAADLWRHVVLLTGPQMTKEMLLKEIDRDPDVIHIASHVIESQDRWHSGILALRMNPSGEPDLLTSREIELHPVHSRLVVMTGCSSGSGEALPASGLMGLTRAWLAAGAGEVLATRWPTTDESDDGLIGSFYLHLLASPDGNIPEALRKARLAMIARGGWRAEPRYWSSFFLIGVR